MGFSLSARPPLGAIARAFRQLDPDGPNYARELARANKAAAMVVVAEAQLRAKAMGGEQAAAAEAIKGANTANDIRLRISATARAPWALAAFWGTKQRTGWYAAGRYRDSTPQHLPWVGNTWDVGRSGQGPYAVNEAIAAKLDEAIELWGQAFDRLIDSIEGD